VLDWKFLEIRDVLETLHAWGYTRGPHAVKQEAMRSNPILRLWRAAVAALVAALVAPSFLAAALTPGQILQDALPIGGKRVPLPEGPWRVAGIGTAESALRLEDWTAEAIRADQSRRGAAEILTLWALGFDARIERGLRNRPMPGPAPMPLVAALASDTPTVDAKLAGLESLYRGGLLPERAYLEQSAAALVEMPRRVVSDPALLSAALRKNLSFRFFGSIVDYRLALVVTANHAVSGAITATIVLVHSMVFVLNDNYWDDYWAQRVTRDSERIVDFLQIGGT